MLPVLLSALELVDLAVQQLPVLEPLLPPPTPSLGVGEEGRFVYNWPAEMMLFSGLLRLLYS